MRLLSIFILSVVGCGGGASPDMGSADLSMNGSTDLAHGVTDLAGAVGDLAGCTPPTSGFYVLVAQGAALALVSTDPNSWDGGPDILLVDGAGNPLSIASIAVSGSILYANQTGHMFQGSLNSIQNGKLILADDGQITGNPQAGDIYTLIAPNGSGGAGNLMVSYGSISSYLGGLNAGSGSSTLIPANLQFPAANLCRSLDFEGTATADGNSLVAVCGNSIVTIKDGNITGTTAMTANQLVGMQAQGSATYVMDGVGNVYDLDLNLIKKTRQCLPVGNPDRGQPVYPVGL